MVEILFVEVCGCLGSNSVDPNFGASACPLLLIRLLLLMSTWSRLFLGKSSPLTLLCLRSYQQWLPWKTQAMNSAS
jgi:hypothetical protein